MKKLSKYLLWALLSVGCYGCATDEPDNENTGATEGNDNSGNGSENNGDGNEPGASDTWGDLIVTIDGSSSTIQSYKKIDESSFLIDGIRYLITDTHIDVTGYDSQTIADSVTIFGEVNIKGISYPTLAIRKGALMNAGFTRCKLPSSLRNIEPHAFEKSGITKLVLPEGINTIESSCFANSALTDIEIPASVHAIGSQAFAYCANLKDVKLPANIILGDSAFTQSGLKSVEVNSPSIPPYAFNDCADLSSVTLEAGQIRPHAFTGCGSLSAIRMKNATPPAIDQSFDITDGSKHPAKLHVSKSSYYHYIFSEWGDLFNVYDESGNNLSAGWEKLGIGTFTEGFVTQYWGEQPTTHQTYIMKHKDNDQLFRLINPYRFGFGYPLADSSTDAPGEGPWHIDVDCTRRDMVVIRPQRTGFLVGNEQIIANAAGCGLNGSDTYDKNSRTITINFPMLSGDGGITWNQVWKVKPFVPAKIVLPDK